MTDDARRAKQREYMRKRRAEASPEKLAQLREADRRWNRARLDRESSEDRGVRLARQRAYYQSGPGRRATFESHLRRKYKISREEYDALVIASCGRCEVCGGQDSNTGGGLSLDHDHDTGLVRGVLCTTCNLALGYMRDSPLLLAKLAAYVALNGGTP